MIKGLTDTQPDLPLLGIIRKGAPRPETGNRPGADLEWFRFDTDDKDALAAFHKEFGDKPKKIEIRLPYATTDENFEAWRKEYVASGLKHKCDGETCVQWLDPKTGKYSFEPRPCPTPEPRKLGDCKQVGDLKVIIPALNRFAFVEVTTTSIWDILTIYQNLKALEIIHGTLRNIPLIVRRGPREISTPADGGKRARRTKSLITIEAKPAWAKLQLEAMGREAMLINARQEPLMLETNLPDDEEETIQGEVVHDAEVIEPKAEKPATTKSASPPATTPGGKQILALAGAMKVSDDELLTMIISQCGVESDNTADAVDGISKEEQADIVKQLKARK